MRTRGLRSALLVTLVAGGCVAQGAPGPSPSPGRSNQASPSLVKIASGAKGIAKIDHLIFIVQENRSFDHYFGTFPGANGFPTNAQGKIDVCIPNPFLGHCSRPHHTASIDQVGGPHDHPTPSPTSTTAG